MDRCIRKVIDRMMTMIPESEGGLRERLDWLKGDSDFKAPEEQVLCWQQGGEILEDHLHVAPTEGWPLAILRIWRGGRRPPGGLRP